MKHNNLAKYHDTEQTHFKGLENTVYLTWGGSGDETGFNKTRIEFGLQIKKLWDSLTTSSSAYLGWCRKIKLSFLTNNKLIN